MSMGQARISKDAHFDGKRSMDRTNLFPVNCAVIGIARPLLYCIAQ
jgi:hypothetical protein